MTNLEPVVVCYKRDKKFYWSIKSKGYDTKEQAIAGVPDIQTLRVKREKNKDYNEAVSFKTKGEQKHGEKRKSGSGAGC